MISYKPLLISFGALMILLAATMAITFAPLAGAHAWIALFIAVTKTWLVVAIFMGLTRSTGAVRMAAGIGVLWLAIIITLVMADYMSRGWQETQAPSTTWHDGPASSYRDFK
ncbi:MAG: cytochrome C oxidase subunit IV family protein [Aureliella sp.]